MTKHKTVLVTGAAGFLGSYISERFIDEGHRVIGVDNLSTGTLGNVQHLFGKGFQFMRLDVNDEIHVEGDIDQIVHAASTTTSSSNPRMLQRAVDMSTMGVPNVLRLAKKKGARVLLLSAAQTSQETHDASMGFQEAQMVVYKKAHGVETQVARIYNAYGPRLRLRDHRVLPTFIRQALLAEDLTIYGDGQQVRRFCYVDDVVEAIFRLLESAHPFPIDIAGSEEVTIQELAQEIRLISGKQLGLEFLPKRVSAPHRRHVDLSHAKEILDWEPKVSRAAGLIKTYTYYLHLYQQGLN